ncbi:VOC family protein [Streptomyces azureus]|uniref:Glyoxalase n=1 Tax=Streptomyces azureus TaxID=146537 RepID=A0A0K8PH50_STRAJ|nr:VOC family protein [Streptomyces azureus]GAP46724.1 glyoxalase [Streptomyces azureus]
MIVALDHVQLAAPPGSEERLRAYCADVLGMTETPKPPPLARRGGCWFQAGAVQLRLGTEEDFRAAKKARPGLRVTGIDAYAARLEAHGAPVTWDSALPGHKRFYSQDPVGNRLEFLEPL